MTQQDFTTASQTWWDSLSDDQRQTFCNIHLTSEVNVPFTGQIMDHDIKMMYCLEENIDPAEIN